MYPNNPGPTRAQIYARLDKKSTGELLEIWRTGAQAGWRGVAYDIVGEILQRRLGGFPQAPTYSAATGRSPRTPWLLIIGGIAVVVILAAVAFSPLFTGTTVPTAATPSQTAVPVQVASPIILPTFTPSEAPTIGITPVSSRPLTGVIMPNQNSSGYGELSVENGTSQDGVVILTLNNASVMAAYIRAGDTFTLRGIRDGIYYLYFSTGSDWNGKAFTINPSYMKFEDAFPFTTSSTTYKIWSVTLQPVVGGTAAADVVDESAFPSIGN